MEKLERCLGDKHGAENGLKELLGSTDQVARDEVFK